MNARKTLSVSAAVRSLSLVLVAYLAGCAAPTPPATTPPAATPPTTSQATQGESPIGGPCKGDADCARGLFCATDDPGGQCMKKCSSSADCGQGAVCSDEKKCYRACQSNADCTRAGYACTGQAPNKFCDVADEDGDKEDPH